MPQPENTEPVFQRRIYQGPYLPGEGRSFILLYYGAFESQDMHPPRVREGVDIYTFFTENDHFTARRLERTHRPEEEGVYSESLGADVMLSSAKNEAEGLLCSYLFKKWNGVSDRLAVVDTVKLERCGIGPIRMLGYRGRCIEQLQKVKRGIRFYEHSSEIRDILRGRDGFNNLGTLTVEDLEGE